MVRVGRSEFGGVCWFIGWFRAPAGADHITALLSMSLGRGGVQQGRGDVATVSGPRPLCVLCDACDVNPVKVIQICHVLQEYCHNRSTSRRQYWFVLRGVKLDECVAFSVDFIQTRRTISPQ